MAFTMTRQFGPWSNGPLREVIYTALFDNAYASNGESLTPAMVGLSQFVFVDVHPIDETGGEILYAFDYANQKIVALFPTGGTGTVPTSLANPIIESGTTAVTGSAATGKFSPGKGIEIGAADLSTITVRIRAMGF